MFEKKCQDLKSKLTEIEEEINQYASDTEYGEEGEGHVEDEMSQEEDHEESNQD